MKYALEAFKLYQNISLQALYGRKWHKNRTIQVEWTGYSELKDKHGKRCHLHIHSRLDACVIRRLDLATVEAKLEEAWDRASRRAYPGITLECDLAWVPSLEGAIRVDAYSAKNANDPSLPVAEFRKLDWSAVAKLPRA